MKKQKKKIILISSITVVIAALFIGLMIYLNNSQNSYTFLERKWMDNNSNTIMDVYIKNGLPLFSRNGSGVYYDLLSDLETNTNLTFTQSYAETSTITLGLKDTLTADDIEVFKDHYVLLSSNNVYITDLSAVGTINVGILNSDVTRVSNNLKEFTNITYQPYNDIESLKNAMKIGSVDYIVVALYENLENIITNSYNILYHFDNINRYYTISFNNTQSELKSIINKFYNRWENRKEEKFNEYFVSLFYDLNKYTELEKDSIINDDYLVGYIDNIPLEGKINNTFSGLTNTYLSRFSELTGSTYKYVRFKNVEKLNKAINEKKIDIAYNSYGINNSNYVSTNYVGSKSIVVLVSNSNDLVIDSIYDLSGKTVTLLKSRSLDSLYTNKKIFTIKEEDSVESLLKSINKDSIVIVEKEVYDYYKSNKLKKYKVAYIYNEYVYDSFILDNSNGAFNKLFTFYMSTTNTKELVNDSVEQTLVDKRNNIVLTFIVDNVFYLIIVLLIIGYLLYRFGNKIKLSKKIKKEDKLLYLDIMTNLKNRNYLNDNVEYWEKNVIYPQTIIILDLNKIKVLNDKNGHESGDSQIKACANVLIKTQRDNSEIMRTDGNEFTIYLVGYEEKMIMSYIHKLNKELKKDLPYKDYGVSIGYSMINDQIKTIDDAINEALIMVKENKDSSDGEV